MKTNLWAATIFVLMAACAAPPPTTSQRPPSSTTASHEPLPQPTAWRAVLVAGDDQEPAFDNAVDAMAGKLTALGVPRSSLVILKANGENEQEGTAANIAGAFDKLAPAAATDGCFVFITSHGAPARGLVMTHARAFLSPANLDHLLADPCQGRPTVVIASGCYSGSFAEGVMPASNRVILTAARDDRPSFGCNASRRFTVFDQCILDSIVAGSRWWTVIENARTCIDENERALQVDAPSEPQASFGAQVTDLLVLSPRS
jgi:hypothetical protein